VTSRLRLPPLADTLGVLLPDVLDTRLLRACLGDGATAGEAWTAIGSGLPKVLAERPACRGLLPLLHFTLSGHGIDVGEPSLAILRAAILWEQRRATHIRTILLQVLDALRSAGTTVILAKDVAVAACAYPRFELRHCHEIVLLVEAEALGSSRDALVRTGFVPAANAVASQLGKSVQLHHKDGLPVVLATLLWPGSIQGDPLPEFRRRARMVDIDGQDVPVLAPMDMLLHACGHDFPGPEPGNWAWVADIAMIRRWDQPSATDWADLVRTAMENGLAFRLALRLSDLSSRIGLAIPGGAVEALVDAAWHDSHREREAAISAARGAFGVRLDTMLREGGWRSRLTIARWALRRSPRYLRAKAML
jgi:Uncharacterised nucleotidyltransferase